MDYSKILTKYYLNHSWSCGDTYDSLEWYDTTIPKPTEEELELKYDDLLLDEMREKRNQLLKESDYTALQTTPNETNGFYIGRLSAIIHLSGCQTDHFQKNQSKNDLKIRID